MVVPMNQFRTVIRVLLLSLLILLTSVPVHAEKPARGNYVPVDLNVKIHPLIEEYRYDGKYFQGEIIKQTSQGLRVTIEKDETLQRTIRSANVNLSPQQITPGRDILVKQTTFDDNPRYLVTNLDRTNRYLLLVGFCLLTCLLIGGVVTFRALSGVVVGLAYLFYVALPLVQMGYNLLLQMSIFYLIVTLLVLPASLGFNRKSLSAILAALSSGLLAGGLIFGLAHWLNLVGLRDETLQVLEYATRYFPDAIQSFSLINIIITGTLIGALGVILDVTVDVTSSAAEIARSRPDLSIGEHLKRTLTVSSQLIGTMTNTLLLAYIGTDLFLILTVYILPTSPWLLINKDFVAVEVVRGLGGALGFLSAAPLAILYFRFLVPYSETPPEPPDSMK
jgi:uncharacterized membrane protein